MGYSKYNVEGFKLSEGLLLRNKVVRGLVGLLAAQIFLTACGKGSNFKLQDEASTNVELSEYDRNQQVKEQTLQSKYYYTSDYSLPQYVLRAAPISRCQQHLVDIVDAAIGVVSSYSYGVITCLENLADDKYYSYYMNTYEYCFPKARFNQKLKQLDKVPECQGYNKEPITSLMTHLDGVANPLKACLNGKPNDCLEAPIVKKRTYSQALKALDLAIESIQEEIEDQVVEEELIRRAKGGKIADVLNYRESALTRIANDLRASYIKPELSQQILEHVRQVMELSGTVVFSAPGIQNQGTAAVLQISQSCSSSTSCLQTSVVKVATADKGKQGSLFAWVIGTGGKRNYFQSYGVWVNEAQTQQPIAHHSGTLEAQHTTMLYDGDTTPFAGLDLCIGYGLGANAFDEMQSAKRFKCDKIKNQP